MLEASSSTQFDSSDAINTLSKDSRIITTLSSLPLSGYLFVIQVIHNGMFVMFVGNIATV